MQKFDLLVIGGGPGGCHAASYASSKGLKTALVEKKLVGGVCLNWGCIPTKSLLSSAKLLERMEKSHDLNGEPFAIKPNWMGLLAKKNLIVATLRKGMEAQLERSGVERLNGCARFLSQNQIEIESENDRQIVESKYILIATGSKPRPYHGIPFDSRSFLSSDDILGIDAPPAKLVIIGGGAVGVEFASLFHSLGSKVVIVEMTDRLLPGIDSDLGKRLEISFRRRGIEVVTHARVSGFAKSGASVLVQLDSGKSFQTDQVLISIGRMRNTDDLGLELAGIEKQGDSIKVSDYFETTAPNVFAIGDVTLLPQLAHVASFSATCVIDQLVAPGNKKLFPKHAIPNCVFSDPQVATVGWSAAEAEAKGISIHEARVLLGSQGKSHVEGELEGFVKIVVQEDNRVVIGGHVMGGEASEMIGVLSLAVANQLTVDQVAQTIFPHPTYHELISDAAQEFLRKS